MRFFSLLVPLASWQLAALAADPYPDQPGALSAEELRAANAAMESKRGAAGKLPLTASGRREMPYAVFAGPGERGSAAATRQPRLLCYAAPGWSCREQIFYTLQGHAFAYTIEQGAPDLNLPARLMNYFDQCFNAQYQALAHKPYPGERPPFSEVIQVGRDLAVSAGLGGDTEVYQLSPPDPAGATAGPPCDFNLMHTRGPRVGFYRFETAEIRQAEAKIRRESEDRRQRDEKFRRDMERLANLCIYVTLLSAPLAFLLPFGWLLVRGRRAVVGIAVGVGAVAVLSGIGALHLLELARVPEAAFSVLAVIAATLLTLLICAVWIVVGATAPREPVA